MTRDIEHGGNVDVRRCGEHERPDTGHYGGLDMNGVCGNHTESVSAGDVRRAQGGGVGLAFGLRVESIEREQLVHAVHGSPYDPERVHAGEAAERSQYIAMALSGSLLIGGAMLYWIGHRRDRAAQTTAWTPMIQSGVAGIAFTGMLP